MQFMFRIIYNISKENNIKIIVYTNGTEKILLYLVTMILIIKL